MQLIEMDGRTITLELTPEDCFALALACDAGATEASGSQAEIDAAKRAGIDPFRLSQLLWGFTAMFEAAAVGAARASHMTLADQRQTTCRAMRDGELLDPIA